MRGNSCISQWKRFCHPIMDAATSAPPIPLNKLA
nr:MAG TPA: alpha-amylase inhibitor [Caudoviricetes sp.]